MRYVSAAMVARTSAGWKVSLEILISPTSPSNASRKNWLRRASRRFRSLARAPANSCVNSCAVMGIRGLFPIEDQEAAYFALALTCYFLEDYSQCSHRAVEP